MDECGNKKTDSKKRNTLNQKKKQRECEWFEAGPRGPDTTHSILKSEEVDGDAWLLEKRQRRQHAADVTARV